MPPKSAEPLNTTNKDWHRRNLLLNDGMHLCMETLGARLYATIACLVTCTKNDNDQQDDDNVYACERQRNAKFMSLYQAKILSKRLRIQQAIHKYCTVMYAVLSL